MYGLPHDFDGAFFAGQILDMVCFNQNQIYFHFSDKLTLKVEGEFSFKTDQHIQVPPRSSDLMEMIGNSVLQVTGDSDGTLTIQFVGGPILRVFDTTNFESYSISYKGREILV